MSTTRRAARHPGRAKIKPEAGFLLPSQDRWASDPSPRKLMEKGRQLGITLSSAKDDVCEAGDLHAKYDVWVSSRDEIQARLYIEDCKHWAKVYDAAAVDLGEVVVDDKGSKGQVLQFANGHRITSLTSSPDAQAGKRGSRRLDEFALNPDNRKLYAIAYPGITWGGRISILSTHRGSHNFFNELVREVREKGNPKRFSLHRFTLQDALAEGFLWKLQEKLGADHPVQEMDEAAYFDYVKSGCPDEETFAQEYLCVPADDDSAFLEYELITAAEYPAAEVWETDLATCTNPVYVGVDVGRKRDLTVIWAVEVAGGRKLTRRKLELRNRPFDEQEHVLYELLSLPCIRRTCIDATGIGRQFAERAIQRFGAYRVEGVTFTPAVKEELAYPLRSDFEARNVRIPYDLKLRSDLRAVRKVTTAAGNIRFTAESTPDGHSDRFWALALALHAAAGAAVPFTFEAVPDLAPDAGRLGAAGEWLGVERGVLV